MKRLLLLAVIFTAVSCSQPTEQADPAAENVALVKKAYDAFGAGDISGVLAVLADDVVWNEAENEPYADGNPYIGHDAVVNGVFARLGSEWDGFSLADISMHGVDDNMVLVMGRYKGTFKANSNPLDAQFAHVWWIKDGKVAQFQQYTDTEQYDEVTEMEDDEEEEGEDDGEEETGS